MTHCSLCLQDTIVIDSRTRRTTGVVRRRRQCVNPECKKRFTTYEVGDDFFQQLAWAKRYRVQATKMMHNVLGLLSASAQAAPSPLAAPPQTGEYRTGRA